MISSKQLIADNNEKRKLLNKENEKYYEDMLVYIRIKSKASEQESEEILMELLDHLIEAQQEGKTAAAIFGADPKGYADELIRELPKETWWQKSPFFLCMAANFLAWYLFGRGIFDFILGFFLPVDTTIFMTTSALVFSYFLLAGGGVIWLIFYLVERSLFNSRAALWKIMLAGGVIGTLYVGIGMLFAYLLPDLGPAVPSGWLPSLISGILLWLLYFWIKHRFSVF